MKRELSGRTGAMLGGLPLVLLLIWGCDMSVNEAALEEEEPVQTLSVAEVQRQIEMLVPAGELITTVIETIECFGAEMRILDAEQLQKELMVSHYFDSAMSSFLSQESGGLQTP